MLYVEGRLIPAKAIADLREAVGWNRMENAYLHPLMTSYCHIAAYNKDS